MKRRLCKQVNRKGPDLSRKGGTGSVPERSRLLRIFRFSARRPLRLPASEWRNLCGVKSLFPLFPYRGFDKDQNAAAFAEDLSGTTIESFIVKRVLSFDATNNIISDVWFREVGESNRL